MAQVERQAENKKATRREAAKQARGARRASGGSFTLDVRGWSILACLGQAFINVGGALRVGVTRDGGALALGAYYDDDYATEYVRPSEDLWEAASEIAAAWLPNGVDGLNAAVAQLGLYDAIVAR